VAFIGLLLRSFKKISENYKNITFIKLDVDGSDNMGSSYFVYFAK